MFSKNLKPSLSNRLLPYPHMVKKASNLSKVTFIRTLIPCGRKRRKIKEPLDEGERGECKADLKPNIQKTKITTFYPISSWEIVGETMETVTDFIFLVSKITADSDYSHEIKR